MIDYESELSRRNIEYKITGERFGDKYAMLLCPFHADTNPSLSLNLDTGWFQCFAGHCRESGSFQELLAEYEGTSVDNIRVSDFSPRPSELRERVLRSLEAQYHGQEFLNARQFKAAFKPIKGTPGERYMRSRGIPREYQRWFGLRWGSSGKYVDRVVIPTQDDFGRLVSYTGRHIRLQGQGKVRRRGATEGVLFGLWHILRCTEPRFPVVLVEGEVDAMYLQVHGVPAVSPFGTRPLTRRQIAVLRRYASYAAFAYDGDDAGRKAVFGGYTESGEFQVGNLAKVKPYLKSLVREIPDERDPNELDAEEIYELFERERHGWKESKAETGRARNGGRTRLARAAEQ